MTFLRVWRYVGDDSTIIGMRLCIVDTTAEGELQYIPAGWPNLSRILYCGPTIVHFLSDHVHPTEFRWDFDPPLVLPHRGEFVFSYFRIRVSPSESARFRLSSAYEGGNMWYTGRSRCILGPGLQLDLQNYPQYDLVFQAGFCRDTATPAKRTSWGQLKRRYR